MLKIPNNNCYVGGILNGIFASIGLLFTFHFASKTAHQEETGAFKRLMQDHYCNLTRGHVTALIQPARRIPSRGILKVI